MPKAMDFPALMKAMFDVHATWNEANKAIAELRDSCKKLSKNHIEGPLGVRGRNSDNHLIREKLGWAPSASLKDGITPTYHWINKQAANRKKK